MINIIHRNNILWLMLPQCDHPSKNCLERNLKLIVNERRIFKCSFRA